MMWMIIGLGGIVPSSYPKKAHAAQNATIAIPIAIPGQRIGSIHAANLVAAVRLDDRDP